MSDNQIDLGWAYAKGVVCAGCRKAIRVGAPRELIIYAGKDLKRAATAFLKDGDELYRMAVFHVKHAPPNVGADEAEK